MITKTRLNLSVKGEDLELIKSVVSPRKISRFIMEAALEKAKQLKRLAIRQQIIEAYIEDPEFIKNIGAEWDGVCLEGWPRS